MSLYCAVQHALEGDHRMADNCVCFRAYSITRKYCTKTTCPLPLVDTLCVAPCLVASCHVMQRNRSRIHERTISLRFLGILILRLEVSVNNVNITNQFQTTFARGRGRGRGVKPFVEVTKNS